MDDFRVAIDDCRLADLGFEGHNFTWTNKQSGHATIQERLDRVLGTDQWMTLFPNYKVQHLIRKSSDHCLILLELFSADCTNQRRIKECGKALEIWGDTHFGNIKLQIRKLREKLDFAQKRPPSECNMAEQKAIEMELDGLLDKEETMWKQRSRCLWLNEGDKNTAFFHKVASGRQRRNRIRRVLNKDGRYVSGFKEVEEAFRLYFQDIFTSQPASNREEVFAAVEPTVTEEMNNHLTRPFTTEEITEALFQMHPLKSPGPDGRKLNIYFMGPDYAALLPPSRTYSLPMTIIFGRAHFQEVDLIKHILTIYEAASGQKVNLEKSGITFSKKIPREVTFELSARLGVRHADSHGTYLGIPSTIGRSKREIFQMLEDRVRKKSKDWKRRFLSAAGKSILIKTILQAIPVYLMSYFLIPEHVCKRLNSLSAQFFWGQRHEERRIHWRNWKSLCRAKWDGGLGFRDISCFNRALLAKQA
ncbi:uncharacterized protein LOC131003172 [Salvia miltiorrhiza]|uniref:uncharacterized protein LOC131003172 n=1 Tax=Salvia miltiorrhiza TaxID=226208 RepID=UPI0025AC3C98|nr:uncharacterized protein LOC131003172 [Salvia miltiorrhiza]